MIVKTRKAPYDHCPNVKMITVEGLKTAQSINVMETLKNIDEVPLIIEIGTCRGGFTLLLRHFFPNAEIHTWDIAEWEPKELKSSLFKEHDINYHLEDCFTSNELLNLVRDDRKKIVFCDGGHKASEFNRFSKEINYGDIIGVHDYFESRDDYDPELWTACEVDFNDLNMEGKFNQVYKHSMQSVWGLFKRI